MSQSKMLCGDFDLQVDFALTGFITPSISSNTLFASLHVYDPTLTSLALNGMSIERYAAGYLGSQEYKSYTSNEGDEASVLVATGDMAGRFRIVRSGTAVRSYYWKTGVGGAGDGQWVLVNTATLSSTPWIIELDAGDNWGANSGATPYSVTFSNLQVTSPGPMDAGTGIGPLADSGAAALADLTGMWTVAEVVPPGQLGAGTYPGQWVLQNINGQLSGFATWSTVNRNSTLSGSVIGDAVHIQRVDTDGFRGFFDGTVSPDGSTMSGTGQNDPSSPNGNAATYSWTAARG
jgi:hypothetical protein